MYRYETAAWNFTDMIFAKPGLIETIQNILTYHQGDSIKCVAIDKQSYCIYEATFLNESGSMFGSNYPQELNRTGNTFG
ncbi:hypothetical protein NXY15_16935 [Bacteroides thetaiotaomicron]|nr:hypothetical protein NXY15_16935 [Bacteroides thetaiotaomicron]